MAGYMKDLGNGKFQFEVSHGKDGKGKRKKAYKTVQFTGSTPEAILKKAEKQLAIFVGDVEKDEYKKPTHYTFASYIDVWKVAAERELAPKTFYRYMELLNSRIIPEIGNTKLEEITAIQLDNFYDKLREPQKKMRKYANGTEKEIIYTLSDQTILHHHRLISLILAKAKKKELLKANPCESADSPTVKKHKPDSYELEDITKLTTALYNTPPEDFKFVVICMIALTGGLRLGEIMGLQHNDIDFVNNTIDIQKARQYIPGQGVFLKSPKNDTSERIISIPEDVIKLIADLEHQNKIKKIMIGNKWNGYKTDEEELTAPIFIQWDGKPMYPYSPSRWFNQFLKGNNLKPLPFHGLRHTSATYLIDQGETVSTVSNRLGHANKSTTLNTYLHAFKKADIAASSKMDGIVPKKESNAKAN